MSSSATTCHLCGLPVGKSNISLGLAEGTVRFCCPGCMYVFQILHNSPEGVPEDYRNTELYKACVAAGLIPSGNGTGKDLPQYMPDPVAPVSPEIAAIQDGLSQELSIKIEGMWCVACSWLIEQLLRRMDGVLGASIFFFSDIARIKYMPHRVQPQTIMDGISRLGYKASPVAEGPDSGEGKSLIVRLGISAILSMNIMMISLALYYGFFEDIGREAAAYFSYPLWVMATPVVFYSGLPILRKAFWGVRYRTATMDVLISTGILAAYFYSIVATLRGSIHVYFDTASMLVTLVLLGRFIEMRTREKISAGITALFLAASGKTRVLREGREIWTASEKVLSGDPFRVFPGERVPVDGRIISGNAVLDESIISGESRPVNKGPGAEVPSGALLLDGETTFEASRTGTESSLNQIIALMEQALATKNSFELFADRAMRVLVPAVLLTAACVAFFLLASSVPLEEAFLRALTVLVITCPCALGIATPLARVAAIARARRSGILIRNPAALERADGLETIVFDKTGTVTEGKYILRETVVTDCPEDEALRRVACAELRSDHFLAREVVRAAREKSLELEEPLTVEPLEGLGVIALTGTGQVIAGNRRLMSRSGLPLSSELEQRASVFEAAGATVLFFAWNGEVRGFLVFGDRIRNGAKEVISRLQEQGLEVRIVSGDSQETTRAVARELGVDRFTGQALPVEKVQIIGKAQDQGHRVAMVGDGINDAAALARSDLGITLGSGANLIRECSDASIFGDDLLKIPELLDLSRFSFKIIKQNLFFAFVYNLLGIPLAVSGLLNPLIAAFAMFASSATVISNTFRITRFTASAIARDERRFTAERAEIAEKNTEETVNLS